MALGVGVVLDLVIKSEDLEALESLEDWLRGDSDFRVTARRHPPHPGEMGAGTDALVVVGGTLTGLAPLLKAWLQRPRHSKVKLTLTTEAKTTVIDADRVRVDDLLTILAQLDSDG